MAAAMAVAYYGRDNCSTSQSAAAASIANVIEAILFMVALGGGMYPVHRCSTKGVSTSVGTALGLYEGAAAARGSCHPGPAYDAVPFRGLIGYGTPTAPRHSSPSTIR